jgi:hypothetical protein
MQFSALGVNTGIKAKCLSTGAMTNFGFKAQSNPDAWEYKEVLPFNNLLLTVKIYKRGNRLSITCTDRYEIANYNFYKILTEYSLDSPHYNTAKLTYDAIYYRLKLWNTANIIHFNGFNYGDPIIK